MATLFHAPVNNAAAALSERHLVGDDKLSVTNGALFGNPSPSAPIRVTCKRKSDGALVIFSVEGRTGNLLLGLTPIEGTLDLNLAAEDSVYARITAATISDLNTAVNTLENMVANVQTSSMETLTYATTISLNPSLGRLFKTTTVNATGNATINASSGGSADQELVVLVLNDSTSPKTITFGTNFRSSGTLTGTASKGATVTFRSDGVSWFELGRSTGL